MNGALRKQLSLNGSNPGFKQETYIAKITAIESGVMFIRESFVIDCLSLGEVEMSSMNCTRIMRELVEPSLLSQVVCGAIELTSDIPTKGELYTKLRSRSSLPPSMDEMSLFDDLRQWTSSQWAALIRR